VLVSRRTGQPIEGSPAWALKISPPFDHFYFIDLNPGKTAYLKALCGNRRNVDVITDDATPYLTTKLLPTIQYADYERALCLLDPYGLDLDWEVMRQAGQSHALDMFLNFPVMDMNRNAIWLNPGQAPQGGIERMTRFWGDHSWKQAAYAATIVSLSCFTRSGGEKSAQESPLELGMGLAVAMARKASSTPSRMRRSSIGRERMPSRSRDPHLSDLDDLSADPDLLIRQRGEPLPDQAEQHPAGEAAGEQQLFRCRPPALRATIVGAPSG
jgi:hypothetical protein